MYLLDVWPLDTGFMLKVGLVKILQHTHFRAELLDLGGPEIY